MFYNEKIVIFFKKKAIDLAFLGGYNVVAHR